MSITIEPYSEYSLVVRGDTKLFKSQLLKLEGKFNDKLKGGAGWIFSKKKSKEALDKLKADIASGDVVCDSSSSGDSSSSSASSGPSESRPVSSIVNGEVSRKDYLALLSRVERLEQICSHSPFVKDTPRDIVFEDEDEEEEKVTVGLLRQKVVKK